MLSNSASRSQISVVGIMGLSMGVGRRRDEALAFPFLDGKGGHNSDSQ